MPHTMYPDWPQSDADLIPLPQCDGPKLKPFDFAGTQAIEFLEHIGEGTHSHVFKVAIHKQTYALKLFRFTYDSTWLSPAEDTDPDDRELMSAFYNYSEPFSCECRAFGRLREAGHEELAVRCFGYVLLDEKHEHALNTQFGLDFNGSIHDPGGLDMRSRFLGRNGRPPPLRGIVKQFGHNGSQEDDPDEEDNGDLEERQLRPALARKMLRDVKALQQLGIINIDVAARQFIDCKMSDFSTAVTVPHFLTTPELNPNLTPAMRSAIELETFKLSINDYLDFDNMVGEFNDEYEHLKRPINVYAFPGGRGCQLKHNLRKKEARERIFTYFDPRQYNWKMGGGKGKRQPLRRKPHLWVYYCARGAEAEMLKGPGPVEGSLKWDYKDGFIFPRVFI